MLQLQNVRKTYKTKAGEVNALNGISLTFPSSGLVFITGKSGCGKTTLLNVIGGLDGIDSGEILVQDKKFSAFSATEYDSYRNTFIGFIFQEYNLLPEFTVEKNIKIAMELQGRDADGEELEKLLKDVGIDELRDRNPSELSGGQRQRVAIARALVKQPRIIMADEPTGALDSDTGVQVLDTLKKLSEKTLVIVVSHDREFAEKYADRIIHLVDGRVEQDVSFTEKEINSNVSEQENTLVVREGAELSEDEKNVMAKAVKERKKIELVESLCFRDRQPTGEVALAADEPVTLRKSQMKLKSSVTLGVKSLAVKPIRLIITILISAIAFAVFALFDTIANFSTAAVLKNQLKSSFSETMVAQPDYIVNYDAGDRYTVKINQKVVEEMQEKTGGTVKGIFDLYDSTVGEVKQSFSIAELINSNMVMGRNYYSKTVNGFVEFDKATEISETGKFKDFGYTLVAGEYPEFIYNDGVLDKKSVCQIAISTYLADSITYYLGGNELNGKTVSSYADFLGAEITVTEQKYTIVGVIDCGEIPQKYAPLRESVPYSPEMYALSDDFNSYINAGGQKCIFVAKNFLQTMRELSDTVDLYHSGKVDWSLSVGNSLTTKQAASYVYNAEQYTAENVLLFDGNYLPGNEFSLADNEILIHHLNLENLFAANISALPTSAERKTVTGLISSLETGNMLGNREVLMKIFDMLGVTANDVAFNAKIRQRFTETDEKYEKEVKIVGVYFGVDPYGYTAATRYKLMINKNLMSELSIFPDQGDYNKLLFSADSIRGGIDEIVASLLNESGLTLNWYNNSALSMILDNEMMIRQIADLFLYAALALSLFSVFMLYNYISTSISRKKRSVGVLRALGAGGKDILLTFLSESVIVAVINGVLANIFAVMGCSFVNSYIVEIMNVSVHFALFGVRQILIISAVSLLTAIISSALPIIKIARKKPVELIRRS